MVKIPYQKAVRQGNVVRGIIPVLDIKYGNVWTNIPKALFEELQEPRGLAEAAEGLARASAKQETACPTA